MIRCGKTGAALLYGTKCVGCDCQLAGLADGGFIPRGTEAPRVMGFDLSSGPDRSATAHVRVGQDYRFVVEDIELHEIDPRILNGHAEQIRRHRERMEEALWGAFGREGWGPPPRRNAVEIITDPNDRRGFDARPCRVPGGL